MSRALVQVTDLDRSAVEPVMDIAETSDLPGWALTQLRGAAARAVAKARAEGYRAALREATEISLRLREER